MNTKIAILGAGESGVGAALLAKQQGAEVWVSDGGKIADRFRSVLIENAIPFEEGKHTKETFFDSDLVIKSPGIPEHAAIMQEIRASHRPVISEIEYAFRCSGEHDKIIAITGSNGKTTTTSLIWHLLHHVGSDAALVGNIGKSFAWQIATDPKPVYVLEVSSFQLDDIDQFRPDVALLLNITPDHLDRYGYDMARYANAKFRITENQQADDTFIYCVDDPETMKHLPSHPTKARKWAFSLEQAVAAKMEANAALVHGQKRADFARTQLLGPHNQRNVLAALLATEAIGEKRYEQVEEALYSFEAIEHRLEKVSDQDGVLFINDSKATNVDSVYYAIKGLVGPIIWIAGGVDKGNNYQPLIPLVKEKVKALIILGEHREPLDKAFHEVAKTQAMSMAEAVEQAKQIASAGDTVLLSPACASFDLFRNYEDRGRQFKNEVLNY
ncbi:MAG: UDP-N-acetylmuramoyl-L-alanine--D-glutamate ligase [Bacteroidota bacterium]